MGQALCTCGGRADDDHALLFGAALAKAKLQHQHQQRYHGGRSPLITKKGLLDQQQQHGSLYHSRGETNELSDDIYMSATAAAMAVDDLHYYNNKSSDQLQQRTALALAEAFKHKLAESPLGPHEKMQFLLAPRACDSADASDDDDVAATSIYSDTSDDLLVSEADWKQRAQPLVSIIVPPGPCGLVLQVDTAPGQPPVVDGFVRKPDGTKGVIENSAMVTRGSELCAINDIDVTRMALRDVVRTLNLSGHLERRFVFRNVLPATATRTTTAAAAAAPVAPTPLLTATMRMKPLPVSPLLKPQQHPESPMTSLTMTPTSVI